MNGFWGYLGFLLDQAWRNNAWLISWLLLAACPLALMKNYVFDRTAFQARHLVALTPLLFPVVLLLWATVFEHTRVPVADVPQWQVAVPHALLVLQVAINVACFFAFRGIRLSVFTVSLFQAYWTLYAWLIAIMSVEGEWL